MLNDRYNVNLNNIKNITIFISLYNNTKFLTDLSINLENFFRKIQFVGLTNLFKILIPLKISDFSNSEK